MSWCCLYSSLLNCVSWLVVPVVGIVILLLCLRIAAGRALRLSGESLVFGFFHPYCNAGGGGEKVLWTAVNALLDKYKNSKCVIYTGDLDATSEEIFFRAKQRFNVDIASRVDNIQFVYLRRRWLVESQYYPVATLAGQSLGSMLLGWEALCACTPDVFVDTMGYAFILPIAKYLFRTKLCISYVHYPTISTDMLCLVDKRTKSFNNSGLFTNNYILSRVKLLYYKLFACFYGVVGRCSDVVMVNSSWTKGHVDALWHCDSELVYPPCSVERLEELPISDSSRKLHIVSVAQFRPEKNHGLQLRALAGFLAGLNEAQRHRYRLVVVGGVRDEADRRRVDELELQSLSLGIRDRVDFRINLEYDELLRVLGDASIGIHTMRDEHFGIGVVEFMAAGLVALAHRSGGPLADIVSPDPAECDGFLADSLDSYVESIDRIFAMSESDRTRIRLNARNRAKLFRDECFCSRLLEVVSPAIDSKPGILKQL